MDLPADSTEDQPAQVSVPRWEQVDVKGVQVERVREFGQVYLALALWRVLELWMKGKGLGSCARQLVAEIGTIKFMDAVLRLKPQLQTLELRLRIVAKPNRMESELLRYLDCHLPTGTIVMENVVANRAL